MQNFVAVEYLFSGVPKDNKGIVGMLQPSPSTPNFQKHVESTQSIVEKYFQTLCRLIEPHKPSRNSRFTLYGFSMLLQHKQILSIEQKHKLKHTKHYHHKNVRTNGPFDFT